jgi:hypothetical protein
MPDMYESTKLESSVATIRLEGDWNVLAHRTMQASRYSFDASGVVFVVAAYT